MTPVACILSEEIKRHGPVPFARFMELSLYCPKIGYYERNADMVGQLGDFYTSVTAGPLFAELLAFQAAQWLEALGDGPLCLVEAGAHDGRLARTLLTWLKQHRVHVLERLVYWLVEPSEARKHWQRGQLEEFAGQIRWAQDWEELPPVVGVIFSNELLDAMPVHRLAWDAGAKRWQELGVGLQGEQLVWVRLAEPTINLSLEFEMAGFHFISEIQPVLPDGFTIEISPTARQWWSQAAGKLQQGRLLTFDYGFTAEQFFVPSRAGGTLRSYQEHHLVADVLANPGEQDITAHINFTQIEKAGETAGLKTESLLSQERFLGRIVGQTMQVPASFGQWTSQRVQQLQVLTHPEHLGRPFQVLVQMPS